MKKRNFITGFSAAFVALITLASCGGIRSKDGVYLTINGKEYYAKDLYNDQKTPAAAEAKFNAVYKVAIRRYFENDQEGHIYMDEITRETKLKISGAKEEAKSNSDKNKTKYDDEWKKILTSNGVDDETGLYNKFEYDLQKAKFEDVIYSKRYKNEVTTAEGKKINNNYDVLRIGGVLRDNDGNEWGDSTKDKIPGYLESKFPYHIKHILVKISAKENDDVFGEITSAEAAKLCRVITQLANGTSFETVASSTDNDDETARKNHGSLGIMSKDTEFVNDFKLGTYLFEAYFSKLTNCSTHSSDKHKPVDAKKILGLEKTVEQTTTLTEAGKYADAIVKLVDPSSVNHDSENVPHVGRIPYGVIKNLSQTGADGCPLYETDLSNPNTAARFTGISDVKAKYYPRNIIFNKYFNKHNIMVITNSDKPKYKYDFEESKKFIECDNNKTNIRKGIEQDLYYDNSVDAIISESAEKKAGFKSNLKIKNGNDIQAFLGKNMSGSPTKTATDEQVLCDENGRIILVFRSGTSGSKTSNDSSGYQGIHFVVIERSPFIGNEYDTYYEGATPTEHTDATSLEEYYTQYYPDEIDGHHPTYTGDQEKGKNKRTYVNYLIGEEQSKLKDRASTVKSELKKTDANLNTYVFDYLMKKGDIKFNQSSEEAKALQTTIDTWIEKTKRNYTKITDEKKWNETWETYYENLQLRNVNRKFVEKQGEKIAPEALVDVFAGVKDATFKYNGGTFALKDVFGKEGAYNE